MNKRELSIEEIKEIEISILDFVMDVAKKNNIECLLDGGTLLGAVRHQGFIPWDDDIDVIVPRKDYDRLLDIIRKSKSPFCVLSWEDNHQFPYAFAQVCDPTTEMLPRRSEYRGKAKRMICVDIFPRDNVPSLEFYKKSNKFKRAFIASFDKMSYYELRSFISIVKTFISLIYFRLKQKSTVKRWRSWCKSTANIETKYSFDVVAFNSPKTLVPTECFKNIVILKFEGKEYPAPAGYDQYLSILYGDYMTPPPENERTSFSHNFRAWKVIDS